MIEQLHGVARVFARYQVHFLQDAQRPQRNVFHVADGRTHQVQRPRSGSAAVLHHAHC